MLKQSILALCLAINLTTAAGAESPKAAWQEGTRTHDAELKNSLGSYLNVKEMIGVKAGETIYFAVSTPRADAHWEKMPRGSQENVSLVFADHKAVLTTSAQETVDLLTVPKWTAPDGIFVTAETAGDMLVATLRDSTLPSIANFDKTPHFDYSAKAVVKAQLVRTGAPQPTQVGTTRGMERTLWRVATARFTYDGHAAELPVFTFNPGTGGAIEKHLFIPFTDATNGDKTYAGGRYVEAELAVQTATHITIDFNRAFNPLCARNHVFNCIKVPGKPLAFKLQAGELKP